MLNVKSLMVNQDSFNIVIPADAGIHLIAITYGFRVKPGMTRKYLFKQATKG